MKLYNLSLAQLAVLTLLQGMHDVARFVGRLRRTVQGVRHHGRGWHCAWILAERK